MKIAIHYKQGDFSSKWIEYCKKHKINYEIVNCYNSDIVSQLKDFDALMWHFNHAHPKDHLFAKQLLFSLEQSGKLVFPDFNTTWHFDDKVGQKYLLEAADLPLVPSYVFYGRNEAINWANSTEYPKVFKLRGGAGSANVKIVRNPSDAIRLIRKAFGKGFSQYDKWGSLKDRWYKYSAGKTKMWDVLKGLLRFGKTTEFARVAGRERGYIYFQDFISGLDHDIRVVVIGVKAFAIKRMVRENDFRASGSGEKYFGREIVSTDLIRAAFEIKEKLKTQCIAFDFIISDGGFKIIEISYGFTTTEVPGYWDRNLNWHGETAVPQFWMVEELLQN